MLCTTVHYQEGIQKQCKQMCEVFICGKNSMFFHSNQSYFLLSFAGKNALCFVIHHCLLLERKIRHQKFSSVLKVKGEFLVSSQTIFLNKFMQMCACLKEHTTEVIDCV